MNANLAAVPAASNHPVATALQLLLRDSLALYLATHHYHWNVEGPHFVSLHTLFEQQYNELFAANDEIAERIRALDSYALPDGYEAITERLKYVSNPLNKDTDKNAVARRMVENLVSLHKEAVKAAQAAKKAAQQAQDNESEDLCIGRIQAHDKAIWMLSSILK